MIFLNGSVETNVQKSWKCKHRLSPKAALTPANHWKSQGRYPNCEDQPKKRSRPFATPFNPAFWKIPHFTFSVKAAYFALVTWKRNRESAARGRSVPQLWATGRPAAASERVKLTRQSPPKSYGRTPTWQSAPWNSEHDEERGGKLQKQNKTNGQLQVSYTC